jgi:hypothetical protein
MSYKPMLLILSLSVLFFSSKCQVESMDVPFIKDQQGLKEEHLKQNPLFEQVVIAPGSKTEEVTRVYPDGSMYFYSAVNPAAPMWAYFTKVKAAGIDQITEIFEAACNTDAPANEVAGEGSETFRFLTKECGKVVVINGVDYGVYKDLQKVNNIVNANLEPFVMPGGK